MKSFLRGSICFCLIYFSLSITAVAQVSASAGASATIVNPIGLTKETDLDFGMISAGSTSGTVVLLPDGSRVQNGGTTLPSATGNVAAAVFNVTGTPYYTFAITLPAAPTPLSCGNNLMTMDSFTSEPAGTGVLDPNGQQEVHVGARLNVGAAQQLGVYLTQNPFSVTVNYN